MSARTAARLAWSVAALSVLALVTGLGLSIASTGIGSPAARGAAIAVAVAFATVGPLIAAREPRNPIGWIFCEIALAAGLMSLSRGYAEYWLDGNSASSMLGETAAWYGEHSWIPLVLPAATFLVLLFPDGRLLSPRWRPIAWCAGVGIVAGFVADGLAPGPFEDYPQVTNPYGVESSAVEVLQGISYLLLLVAIVGSPVSLVLRFRRAGHEQRQQIKWLALAGALAAATVVVGIAGYDVLTAGVADAAILLSVLSLPLAAGIAILKYRLYDIDVVIKRTLVYGALTATLAGAYLGSVLLLQLVLSPSSDLAIAGSTLAVAALFRPARRRIQELVDRRFYRRRYDAARTLESFGGRLRDEVDLDALGGELRGVVAETMQPAHVSLWLRESAR
jgi:hypothetical protein